jgi:hypothetical protein
MRGIKVVGAFHKNKKAQAIAWAELKQEGIIER